MRIGIIGCGAIGSTLIEYVDKHIPEIEIVAILDKDVERVRQFISRLSRVKPFITSDIDEFLRYDMDYVIECASQNAVREYLLKILDRGINVIVLSTGALIDKDLLDKAIELCKRKNVKIIIPSGAISGIDGIKSAAIDEIYEVNVVIRKSPKAFKDAPGVKNINLDQVSTCIKLFEGNVIDAVKLFPANVNILATLALAIGDLSKIKVVIYADPGIDKNVHEIKCIGKFGELYIKCINNPSPKNPKTSYIAALSVIKLLKELVIEKLLIGT